VPLLLMLVTRAATDLEAREDIHTTSRTRDGEKISVQVLFTTQTQVRADVRPRTPRWAVFLLLCKSAYGAVIPCRLKVPDGIPALILR